MNSMMGSAAFALTAPPLGLVAVSTSNQTAMITAGAISLFGVLRYLPALRHERTQPVARRPAAHEPI